MVATIEETVIVLGGLPRFLLTGSSWLMFSTTAIVSVLSSVEVFLFVFFTIH